MISNQDSAQAIPDGWYPVWAKYLGTNLATGKPSYRFESGATGGYHDLIAKPRPGWADRYGYRCPDGALIIDVDDYDGKHGAEDLQKLEAELGPLPPTWKITSRGFDDPGGKFLYQTDAFAGEDQPVTEIAGTSIDIVSRWHKFTWAPGSWHDKTHAFVKCYDPLGNECPMPGVDDLPDLPATWEVRLTREPLDLATADTDLPEPDGMDCPAARAWLDGSTESDVFTSERRHGADLTGGQVRGTREWNAVVYLKTLTLHGHHTGGVIREARERWPALDTTVADRWHATKGHATDDTDCCKDTPASNVTAGTDSQVAEHTPAIPVDGPKSDAAGSWDDGTGVGPVLPPSMLSINRDAVPVPLVAQGTLGLITAKGGRGKSYVAKLAAAENVARAQKTLYVDFETSRELFWSQMAQCGVAPATGVYRTEHVPAAEKIAEMGMALVIVDAVAGFLPFFMDRGDSEWSPQTIEKIHRWCRNVIKVSGATVILIDHHNSKDEINGGDAGRKVTMSDWHLLGKKDAGPGFTRERSGYTDFFFSRDKSGTSNDRHVVLWVPGSDAAGINTRLPPLGRYPATPCLRGYVPGGESPTLEDYADQFIDPADRYIVHRMAEREWFTAVGFSEDLEKFQAADPPVTAEWFRKRLRTLADDGVLLKPPNKKHEHPFRPGPHMPDRLREVYDATRDLMRMLDEGESNGE